MLQPQPQQEIKKRLELSEEERSKFGDRFPEDYLKMELLGRGGFAIVWLGKHRITGKLVAIKQIISKAESQFREVEFAQLFFDKGGLPRPEIVNKYPGIDNILSLVDYQQTRTDTWMIFELGGSTLTKVCYEMKGEFFKGERVYNIAITPFYESLRLDHNVLKNFIKRVAETLLMLADFSVIHCDLKPENILLTTDEKLNIKDLKLIDFGSAFFLNEVGHISAATPEYMPPEVLQILSSTKSNKSNLSNIEMLKSLIEPWSVDVWSLGSIILEILMGVPHWISYKCKIMNRKSRKFELKLGLFSIKNRDYQKIYAKQKQFCHDPCSLMSDFLDLDDKNDSLLADLIVKMMNWHAKDRLAPEEILKHGYLI